MRPTDDGHEELDSLRLLASAIAGTTLEVATANDGDQSWTDGTTVFLEVGATPAEQLQMLGVQASLVAAGSLTATALSRLARRPALARRYLAIEGHRALTANEAVLPPSVRSLIDDDIAAGLSSADASLDAARNRRTTAEPSRVFGTIDARRVLAAAERAAPPLGTAETQQHKPSSATLAELTDDDDDPDKGNLGDLVSNPVGGGGPIGRLLQRMFERTRAHDRSGAAGADAPTHLANPSAGQGRSTTASTSLQTATEEIALIARPGAVYPEWDLHRRRYRPDWCTVIESDPTPGDARALPDTLAMRRALARLGIGLDPCRRRAQGDEIDIDAAVEARVDTLAGSPQGDDYYVEVLRRRRDLAVLVLLDVSGSAGERGTDGKTVHEHQQSAAAALTAALQVLGDRVALYAFNSRGRRAVQSLRVKDFDDPLDAQAARRLGGLLPGAFTRLGAATRHGTAALEARGGTQRLLLVVLSDGFAYDHGYEGRYGEADARRALAEARSRGVGCLCLSVGAATDAQALRRVFGTSAHAAVPSAERLPALIGPLFRAALQSADARRRAFQRRERTRGRLEIERRSHGDSRAAVLPPGR